MVVVESPLSDGNVCKEGSYWGLYMHLQTELLRKPVKVLCAETVVELCTSNIRKAHIG